MTALEQEKGITHYEYDLQGKLIGEESPEKSRRYEYNPFHQQTKVEEDGIKEWNYLYDAEGMREEVKENGTIRKVVYNQTGELSGELTKNRRSKQSFSG